MRILVTGGMGFIGHNVVAQLEDLDHEVLIVDNMTTYDIIPQDELDYLIEERSKKISSVCQWHNITNHNAIEHIFDTFKPELVIHLASFPRQKVVNSNPTLGAKTMIEGLLNLCEASYKHKVNRFVYISSSMVYGDFQDGTDEYVFCKPHGQYAIMKHTGELLVRDYGHRGCFDYTIVRPSAVYGPCDVEDRVVSKFFAAAMNDEVLLVNGQNEKLDFTHVDDATAGIVGAALSKQAAFRTYNIARGESKTLLEAAQLVTQIVGKGKIQVTHKNENFPSRAALSVTAARRDFGFDPKIDIEEGFQRYYEYLKDHPFWSNRAVRNL
jgi:nucleoside-diphosphate-sugar epimerase